MTELLQRVIAELEKLPEDDQDAIAKREERLGSMVRKQQSADRYSSSS
jgi:hypothetical protein